MADSDDVADVLDDLIQEAVKTYMYGHDIQVERNPKVLEESLDKIGT